MVPVTITLGILNFNALIDFFFAQFVSDHAAAQINYSFRLYQLPQGMFAITIGTVLFPTLSRYAAEHDMGGSARPCRWACARSSSSRCRSSPGSSSCRTRSCSSSTSTARSGGRHRGGGAGPRLLHAGHGFRQRNIMFNRGFQSMQRPWLPLYVGLVNLGLNALLDWVLSGRSARAASCCRRRSCRPSTSSLAGADAPPDRLHRRAPHPRAAWPRPTARSPWPRSRSALWHALRAFADAASCRCFFVFIAVSAAGGLVYLGVAEAAARRGAGRGRSCCVAAAARGRRRGDRGCALRPPAAAIASGYASR